MSWIAKAKDVALVVVGLATIVAILIGVPLLMVAMAGWAWRLF